MSDSPYGYELIIDLGGCDATRFSRGSIDGYFEALCRRIAMAKCERFWWDDVGVPESERQTSPHTQGTSAVQFILTSSIVIHTLDQLDQAFVNVFSCKAFDHAAALELTVDWFLAASETHHSIERG